MSAATAPIQMCDHEDGCDQWAFDITATGGRYVNPEADPLHTWQIDRVKDVACCPDHRRAPVQADGPYSDGRARKPRGTVTWTEHVEAARDYNLHHSQSAETLAQRGGFGYWEMTKHLGHEPTTWREALR